MRAPFVLVAGLSIACTHADAVVPAPPAREVVVPGNGEKPNYSAAIRSGSFLFLSGMVALDPKTQTIVPGGIQAETAAILARLKTVLEQAGGSLADVLKCNVYMTDITQWEAMNEVYRPVWPGPPPTRTTVGVAGLPMGAHIEIECLAAAR